ncbi:MAG: hypothetical protein E6Q32_10905 [Neisseriales bacterium]|nr:MAG: hypothetical protein E6Q32_10905 [Neisseriales bacterium]
MLQVIFLDFDGVLHPKMNGNFELINNFLTVLKHFPKATVVISSSWKDGLSKEALASIFGQSVNRIIGCTTSSKGQNRQGEILSYVRNHCIECYIAIDDDCRSTLFEPNCDFLFRTNYFTGLTEDKIPTLIKFMEHRGFTKL